MSAPSIGPQALRLFQYASARSDWSVRSACEQLDTTADEIEHARGQLIDLGLLVESSDGGPTAKATAPEAALLRLLTTEEEATARLADHIRRTRERIDAMREVFLPLHVARSGTLGDEVITGADRIARVLGDTADIATSEILSMHPGPVRPSEVLAEGLRRDIQVLERGVTMRSIHLRPMTRIVHSMNHLRELRAAGAQVRIANIVPFRFILVDRVQALVPALHTNAANAMMVLRGEAVTALLVKVFEMCWASSVPLDDSGADEESGLTSQQLCVLRLMSTGRKDESIAREIGVSVRTLRRVMADLMAQLGVESRFQAGVRAARTGLLD
ncbi:DNA-binding CsgD family transcriptional regulator [Streptomyces achromogenes]|uniref:DNA-binding CsgD family transcriptional regulator n=1 Tax=Streptomyces achromogenes TaxID=67255 RepID=A0ABU0PSK3_STRAH|nr:helix-turn-helix transcriptional regulator [Streptomyces achromogenes]MDQ0681363.1 DNA-binding CsgD family transcriptional regulator [Streptomyces achromogenes]MDQ0828514.1 DNA-binding CsgD family transcriptional regulator [Streptomyces achromogenes]